MGTKKKYVKLHGNDHTNVFRYSSSELIEIYEKCLSENKTFYGVFGVTKRELFGN